MVAFSFVAIAQAEDVGFDNIFDADVSMDLQVRVWDGTRYGPNQDGPLYNLAPKTRVQIEWECKRGTRARGNWSKADIPLTGTASGRISKSVIVKAACIDKEGNRADDKVVVNVSGGAVITPLPTTPVSPPTTAQPSITVTTPSQGETYSTETAPLFTGLPAIPIQWTYKGASQDELVNVSIQKNDADAAIKDLGNLRIDTRPALYLFLSQFSPGQYQVRVKLVSNPSIVAYSGVFTVAPTITAPTPTASPISVDLKAAEIVAGIPGTATDGPLTVNAGRTLRLSYTTAGKVAECKGDVSGYSVGSADVVVNASKTYTVSCSQDGGTATATDSVRVEVSEPAPTPTPTPTPAPTTSGTPTITVTGPLNSYGAPGSAFVTFTSSGVSQVKVEACVNKTDCTTISSATAVAGSSTSVRWDFNGAEPYVGAFGTKPVYLKVTDLASGVFDFADSYMYVTPPTSGAGASSLAGTAVPDTDVWAFLKAFFGGK